MAEQTFTVVAHIIDSDPQATRDAAADLTAVPRTCNEAREFVNTYGVSAECRDTGTDYTIWSLRPFGGSMVCQRSLP